MSVHQGLHRQARRVQRSAGLAAGGRGRLGLLGEVRPAGIGKNRVNTEHRIVSRETISVCTVSPVLDCDALPRLACGEAWDPACAAFDQLSTSELTAPRAAASLPLYLYPSASVTHPFQAFAAISPEPNPMIDRFLVRIANAHSFLSKLWVLARPYWFAERAPDHRPVGLFGHRQGILDRPRPARRHRRPERPHRLHVEAASTPGTRASSTRCRTGTPTPSGPSCNTGWCWWRSSSSPSSTACG